MISDAFDRVRQPKLAFVAMSETKTSLPRTSRCGLTNVHRTKLDADNRKLKAAKTQQSSNANWLNQSIGAAQMGDKTMGEIGNLREMSTIGPVR